MAMPNDLILVRHGESEGNVIQAHIKHGKNFTIPEEFKNRHTYEWRLTDKGIIQAKKAGIWIRKNISPQFDRYYSSNYLRAMETSAYLKLPMAEWFINLFIHERNWGIFDRYSHKERQEKFAKDLESKKINPFYWSPPRGESFAELCLRITHVLNTLHRECAGQKIILVCHGEIIWAFRIILERITVEQYLALNKSKNPHDRIHNGQIIHFTRLNPDTGKQSKYLDWVRSVCPSDLKLSHNEWRKIQRPRYSNQELLDLVAKTKRIIND
jgi:NAD+ kinase